MRLRLHDDESSLPPHSLIVSPSPSELLSLFELAVADAGGAKGDETGVMGIKRGGGEGGQERADGTGRGGTQFERQQRAVV
jgi:hypothetical protein